MNRVDAWHMIQRAPAGFGARVRIGCATGITAYRGTLENGAWAFWSRQTFLALIPISIAQYGLFKRIKANVRLANEFTAHESKPWFTDEAKKA